MPSVSFFIYLLFQMCTCKFILNSNDENYNILHSNPMNFWAIVIIWCATEKWLKVYGKPSKETRRRNPFMIKIIWVRRAFGWFVLLASRWYRAKKCVFSACVALLKKAPCIVSTFISDTPCLHIKSTLSLVSLCLLFRCLCCLMCVSSIDWLCTV